MHDAAAIYDEQIDLLQDRLKNFLRKRSLFGWLRFFVFVITAIAGWKLFIELGAPAVVFIVAGIAILLFLVFKDTDNTKSIRNTKLLIEINKDELSALANNYQKNFDGAVYNKADHDYANDLDIFGKSSLYQWMNRGYTEQGRDLLAKNLLAPLTGEAILQRQEAARELSRDVAWRQQLQAFAMQTPVTNNTEIKTAVWLQEKEKHFIHAYWKIFVQIYTCITLLSIVATLFGYLSIKQFSGLYVVFLFFSLYLSRNTIKPYIQLSGIVKEVSVLFDLMSWIEGKKFESQALKDLQMKDAASAATEIKELKNILDRFDVRLNLAGPLFLTPVFLWDVRQMIALNGWRRKNKSLVKKWFDTIAEFEVLNGIAAMHFNRPHWCFPVFIPTYFTFDAKELGHPLIPEHSCVDNDFDLNGLGRIGLITGSNMAGKSTFLRSIGVNIVLAQMGAPVCAKSFTLSPVALMTSMRIADNLAENTSTFYAELKKLKTIIERVSLHEQVFILLDEILRGTNSLDRHVGAAALISQLIKENTVAVIATHDLELAALKDQYNEAIGVYHFDVQVNGEELFFDYKLKDGICTSLNASILMKKIGIRM